MSRRVGMRAVQKGFTFIKRTRYLPETETTNVKQVADAEMNCTILKSYKKNICQVSEAGRQRLE